MCTCQGLRGQSYVGEGHGQCSSAIKTPHRDAALMAEDSSSHFTGVAVALLAKPLPAGTDVFKSRAPATVVKVATALWDIVLLVPRLVQQSWDFTTAHYVSALVLCTGAYILQLCGKKSALFFRQLHLPLHKVSMLADHSLSLYRAGHYTQ